LISLRIITLLFALFIHLAALAEPLFEAQISATEIPLDETVTLTFIVRANSIGKLRFPVETEDYTVVAQSNATNIRIVNGARSQQHRITVMIQPKHEGKFTLPSASIDAQGFVHSIDPITITVIPARNASAAVPVTPSRQQASSQPATVTPPKATAYKTFAKLYVSNASPYVGEQIKLRMRVYHQGNVKKINFASDSFTFDNCLQEKIDGGVEGEEIIDGTKYYYYELATNLYPIKSGTINIPAQNLSLIVVDVDAMRARAFDPFAQLVNRSFESQQELSSNSLAINVRALPSPRPKNFSGFVGTLNLSHDLDKASTEEASPVTLTLTAIGIGNAKNLNLDIVAKSNQYTVFEDKKNSTSSISGGVRSFRTVLRKAIVPKRSGKINIELLPLVYFDTSIGRYQTIAGTKLEIDVQQLADKQEPVEAKQKIEAKSELMNISSSKILQARPAVQLPLWLMFGLLAMINFVYLFASLRGRINLGSQTTVLNTKKAKKLIQEAESIETIAVLLKELFDGTENAKLAQFFSRTDAMLYSGQSGSGLEEIRVEALKLIEELHHA